MRKPTDFEYHLINGTLLTIAILLMALLATGCTSSKQVNRWLQEKPKEQTAPVVKAYLSLNELFAATWCDTKYPVQESTETETEIIQGNSEELKQELKNAQAEADSLKRALERIPVKPECQPEVVARDRVIVQLQNKITGLSTLADNLKADVERVKTTKTQESSAKADRYRLEGEEKDKENLALQKRLTEETEAHTATQEQLKAVTKHRNTLLWIIGIAVALLIGLKFMLRR